MCADFFGFHREQGSASGSTMYKRTGKSKSSSKKPNVPQPPALTGLNNQNQNSQLMTFNGLYSLSPLLPPPVGQKPGRKVSGRAPNPPQLTATPLQPMNGTTMNPINQGMNGMINPMNPVQVQTPKNNNLPANSCPVSR
jgi:hypothetical protein